MMNKYSLSFRYWESVLQRPLNDDEVGIIRSARCENQMNKVIYYLNEKVQLDGLFIPALTENDGNCLFQSLCYSSIDCSVQELKRCVVNMLLFFKTKKNFIPNQEMSLEELFQVRNEIEYVYCNNTHRLFKYTYDAMCEDMMTDEGWKRIETELLLTMLSIVLNIRFKIYHSNEHITSICPREFENTQIVYLAQIDECHYLPLEKKNGETKYECPFYTDDCHKFRTWADSLYELTPPLCNSDDGIWSNPGSPESSREN